MTESTGLRERLERLASRGDDRSVDRFIATLHRELEQPGTPVSGVRARRQRPLLVVTIAFVTVVTVVSVAIGLAVRDRAGIPHGSPKPTSIQPAPLTHASQSVLVGSSEPALVSRSEGWVCGVPLWHMVDGSWRAIRLPLTAGAAVQCLFVPGGFAWIGVNDWQRHPPVILRVVTQPRVGVTVVQIPGASSDSTVNSITFAGPDRGWALVTTTINLGNQQKSRTDLHATSDGGRHWHRILADAPISGAMRFVNSTTGWAINGDRLERTSDGGRTWSPVRVPTPPVIGATPRLDSLFVFGRRVVVVGVRPDTKVVDLGGEVFFATSSDDGQTWSLRTVSKDLTSKLTHRFGAVDASHWWVYVPYLWSTDDAGRSWRLIFNNVLGAGSYGGTSFITPNVGWMSRCTGNPGCHPTVTGTTDAGKTWKLLVQT